MRVSSFTASLLMLAALPVIASAADQASTTSTNWQGINSGPFGFSIPAGMTNVPVRGIDSLVGRCVSSNIILGFDCGWYSGSSFKDTPYLGMTGYPKFKLTNTTIDGHTAEIVSYQVPAPYTESEGRANVMRIKVLKLGKDGRTALSMWTYCQTEADYAVVQRIFESIRLKHD